MVKLWIGGIYGDVMSNHADPMNKSHPATCFAPIFVLPFLGWYVWLHIKGHDRICNPSTPNTQYPQCRPHTPHKWTHQAQK